MTSKETVTDSAELKFPFRGTGSEHARESLVFDALRTAFRMHMYGFYSSQGENAAWGKRISKEGEMALRVGGQLLGNLFELTAEDVGKIAEDIFLQDDDRFLPGSASLIAGRIAEGLYENGQTDLALEVATKYVAGPSIKLGVEEYFRLCDSNLSRAPHITVQRLGHTATTPV